MIPNGYGRKPLPRELNLKMRITAKDHKIKYKKFCEPIEHDFALTGNPKYLFSQFLHNKISHSANIVQMECTSYN